MCGMILKWIVKWDMKTGLNWLRIDSNDGSLKIRNKFHKGND